MFFLNQALKYNASPYQIEEKVNKMISLIKKKETIRHNEKLQEQKIKVKKWWKLTGGLSRIHKQNT